jgi:hypothetical protein
MKRHLILVLFTLFYVGLNLSSVYGQSSAVQCMYSALPMQIRMAEHQVLISSDHGKDSLVKTDYLEVYKFSLPGNYSLRFIPDPRLRYCSHNHHDSVYKINIAPYAFTYRAETIRFSKPLRAKQPLDNMEMEISVYLEAHNGDSLAITHRGVTTSGIGTSIRGMLDSRIAHLYPGENRLRYHLQGLCSNETYIQFDFIDPLGFYHPIGYPNLIKRD